MISKNKFHTIILLVLGISSINMVYAGVYYITANNLTGGTFTITQPGTYILTENITGLSYTAIKIDADNVVLTGNGHVLSGTGNYYGVLVVGHSGVEIKDLTITNFGSGIYLRYASGNTISNIRVSDNTGSGIWFHGSCNNVISNVYASNNGNGIYLYNSSNNIISNIITTNNNRNGFFLDRSNNNTVSNINAINNGYNGIYLQHSNYNVMSHVTATNNARYGMLFWHSSYNTIQDYDLSGNGLGNCSEICGSKDNVFINTNIKVPIPLIVIIAITLIITLITALKQKINN
jgi:parallel beta-helix repeat protein